MECVTAPAKAAAPTTAYPPKYNTFHRRIIDTGNGLLSLFMPFSNCFSLIFTWYDRRDEFPVSNAAREPQVHEFTNYSTERGSGFEHWNETTGRYWNGRCYYREHKLKTNLLE